MSFWFIPSRTPPGDDEVDFNGDLHETDIDLFNERRVNTWANGSWSHADTDKRWGWGTKSDRYMLSALIGPGFRVFLNEWAPPKVVEHWGRRLIEIAESGYMEGSIFSKSGHAGMLLLYGEWLVAVGKRGIGLYLSN